MFGAGHIDILSALVGGAVIGAIWMAFYLATDEDWREALLTDPDEPYGDVPATPEEAKFGGRRNTGAGGVKADRRKTGDNTHRNGSV